MTIHRAVVSWTRGEQTFTDGRYSRAHVWRFDGGAEVSASASPSVVPAPCSDASAVDPEEAFVASLASCHMLWFLSIAAGHGFRVDAYDDEADGVLARGADGRLAITTVTLRPRATFSPERVPSRTELDAMHHEAHSACFIANSVKSDIRCEPR
ncbi:MAG: OsmC family protein [Planctomycetes bacterium]|nr:OsmC family protein [Planctomycetota bacterium]